MDSSYAHGIVNGHLDKGHAIEAYGNSRILNIENQNHNCRTSANQNSVNVHREALYKTLFNRMRNTGSCCGIRSRTLSIR